MGNRWYAWGLDDARVLLVELAPVTRPVLEAAKSCVAVVRYGTGFDNIDLEAAAQLGIAATNVPGYAAQSVSEHTMALLLAVARRLVEQVDLVRSGDWRSGDLRFRPLGLSGATLGIVGVGAIGKALSVRARAFGMTVLGYDPYLDDGELSPHAAPTELQVLLARSDYVSLHLPLSPDTRGIIGVAALSGMKTGAVLINTSRGGLVDEQALLDALDTGQLSYAALDVTANEPLAADDPLRSHPRVLVTPHVAFWSDQAELALRTSVAQAAAGFLRVGEEDHK